MPLVICANIFFITLPYNLLLKQNNNPLALKEKDTNAINLNPYESSIELACSFTKEKRTKNYEQRGWSGF